MKELAQKLVDAIYGTGAVEIVWHADGSAEIEHEGVYVSAAAAVRTMIRDIRSRHDRDRLLIDEAFQALSQEDSNDP